jgi:hypothetical protein
MKVRMEGMYLNIIKDVHVKPIANITLNEEKLKSFPLVRNETRVPTSIQDILGITTQSNKIGQRNKRNTNR